tara:strand:- start:26 stop:214 length:189 start_codon:yes stop_codon:yes gene_type:complete
MEFLRDKLVSCYPTLLLNANAVMVSMMDVETIFRIVSYGVAIVWTTLKIVELLRDWNNGKKK